MDPQRATVGLAVTLLGCGAERVATGRLVQAIVGGSPSEGLRAVVRVEAPDEGRRCTGTLVARRVVLTAKHCVQRPGAAAPDPPWSLRVGIRREGDAGADAFSSFDVVAVQSVPGAYASAVSALSDLAGADVAVLVLGRVPDVAPLLLAEAPMTGDTLVAAGYGADERGVDGVLRAASAQVRAVAGNTVSTDPVTCDGDSGGPLLDGQGHVAAVLSGAVGTCGTGDSRYTLARAARDLVDAARCASGEGCGGDAAVSLDAGGVTPQGTRCSVLVAGAGQRGGRNAARGQGIAAGSLAAWVMARRRGRPGRTSNGANRGAATEATAGGLR